jgi:hypothetical protein
MRRRLLDDACAGSLGFFGMASVAKTPGRLLHFMVATLTPAVLMRVITVAPLKQLMAWVEVAAMTRPAATMNLMLDGDVVIEVWFE